MRRTCWLSFCLILLAASTGRTAVARQQPTEQEPAEDFATHFNRGDQLLQQFRLYAAIAEFREALRINSGHLPSHSALAVCYFLAGEHALAWKEVRLLRAAQAEPPERLRAALAEALPESEAVKQLGQIENALADAERAAQEQPQNPEVRARLAEALRKAGAYQEAIRESEKALVLDSGLTQAHFLLGRLYGADPQTSEQAIPHLKAFLQKVLRVPEQAKSLAEAYHMLSSIYMRTGRDQEALQALEEGLQGAPADAHLLNNAAWIYATAQDAALRNPSKALQYARKAVEISEGKNASFLDTLAEACYLNGEFEEAVRLEKKAIALRPKDQFLKDQLKKFEEAQRSRPARP